MGQIGSKLVSVCVIGNTSWANKQRVNAVSDSIIIINCAKERTVQCQIRSSLGQWCAVWAYQKHWSWYTASLSFCTGNLVFRESHFKYQIFVCFLYKILKKWDLTLSIFIKIISWKSVRFREIIWNSHTYTYDHMYTSWFSMSLNITDF